MPTINVPVEYTLNGSGSEIPALSTTDSYNLYIIKGTPVVPSIGSYNITYSGTPYLGMTYKILYRGVLTLGVGATFSLFGTQITQSQLLKTWDAICTWNGSSFNVILHMNFSEGGMVSGTNIGSLDGSVIANGSLDLGSKGLNLSLTTGKIADLAVTTAKINDLAVTNAKINDVDGSKIAAATVTNAKLATMADQTVKANVSGGVASPSDVSITSLLSGKVWGLQGNAGTNPGTDFIGTTDAQDLVFKVSNSESGRISIALANTSFGINTLNSIGGSATYNSAFGENALKNVTSGQSNVAVGASSQIGTSIGKGNVSVGYGSLSANTSGDGNTAIGQGTGFTNISGGYNTFLGYGADTDSTNGLYRIALGYNAQATSDYEFAIPDTVTNWKFRGNSFTLPSSDGPANSVLTTNGSGTLSFSSVIDSGTYTPTLTPVTNVAASTAYSCKYTKVGNMVTVSGKVGINATATGATELQMDLPIFSNLGSNDLNGTAGSDSNNLNAVRIKANPTANEAVFVFDAGALGNSVYGFVFMYEILP